MAYEVIFAVPVEADNPADAVMDAVRQLVSRSLLEVAALGHAQEIEEAVR